MRYAPLFGSSCLALNKSHLLSFRSDGSKGTGTVRDAAPRRTAGRGQARARRVRPVPVSTRRSRGIRTARGQHPHHPDPERQRHPTGRGAANAAVVKINSTAMLQIIIQYYVNNYRIHETGGVTVSV